MLCEDLIMPDTAGAAQPEQTPHQLLDLPHHLLLCILQQLDVISLCSTARCSRVLHRLSGHPTLWPAAATHATQDWALGGVRCALASILRLPPQVFHAQLDVRRSRRFPVYVPMHNLRTILSTSDAEGLADRVSRALQECVQAAASSLWRHDSWQQLPPAASICICRADGASIRAALQPSVVVPRMVYQLQQAGWPPPTSAAAALGLHPAPQTASHGTGTSISNSTDSAAMETSNRLAGAVDPAVVSESCVSGGGPAQLPQGLLQVMQLCQQRMELLRTQQLPQLQPLRGGTSHLPAGPGCQQLAGDAVIGHGWRPNLLALQAAAAKLPDEATAKLFAAKAINSQGPTDPLTSGDAATSLAVRLFWAGVAADPGILSYSAAGTGSVRQWQVPLSFCARVVAKVQALQESATQASGCAAGKAAWRAGSAELQLCQSGLQQLLVAVGVEHNPGCQPAAVYRCIQALEVAAGEYWAAYKTDSLISRLSVQQSCRPAAGGVDGNAEVLILSMHTELLRACYWCLWLLGAV